MEHQTSAGHRVEGVTGLAPQDVEGAQPPARQSHFDGTPGQPRSISRQRSALLIVMADFVADCGLTRVASEAAQTSHTKRTRTGSLLGSGSAFLFHTDHADYPL